MQRPPGGYHRRQRDAHGLLEFSRQPRPPPPVHVLRPEVSSGSKAPDTFPDCLPVGAPFIDHRQGQLVARNRPAIGTERPRRIAVRPTNVVVTVHANPPDSVAERRFLNGCVDVDRVALSLVLAPDAGSERVEFPCADLIEDEVPLAGSAAALQ